MKKFSLQKLKIRMSASPGRRQLRLRLSERLFGKLCSGLCNILQSAEIRIDCGMNFWLERVATARRWCRLPFSNDSKGERGGEGVKGKHAKFCKNMFVGISLDEIYKIYMLLNRSDLNISAKIRQTFSYFCSNFVLKIKTLVFNILYRILRRFM